MEELELILTGKVASGVYLLEGSKPVDSIKALVESYNFCFLHLDGMNIANVEQFYAALGLRSKSGVNANQLWDTFGDLEMWFSECTQDISGYIVLYDQFENWQQNDQPTLELYSLGGTIDLIRDALAEERLIFANEPYRKGRVGRFGQYFLLRGDKAGAEKLNVHPLRSAAS